MANTDEPTKPLDDPKDYETKPILAAILERINAVGDELTAFRQDTEQKFQRLETALREFKEETAENFRKMRDSLDILASDVVDVRAGIKRHERQIKSLEELDRKAS